MFAARVFLQLLLLWSWCVAAAMAAEPTEGQAESQSSPAEHISKDLTELSKEVDGITEDGSKEEDTESTEEEQHAKQQEKFEGIYEAALNKGLEEGRATYKQYEHAAVETLDLVGLASEHLKKFWYTGQCRREYSFPCPNGWEWSDEEKACIAPQDYRGPCNNRKDFSNMKKEEREEYAWRCHVSWPCVNDVPIDENALCPMEWTKVSNTLCVAPSDYSGICPPISEFHEMSVSEKMGYEHMCDVKWPRIVRDAPAWDSNSTDYTAPEEAKGISGAINDLGVMVPM